MATPRLPSGGQDDNINFNIYINAIQALKAMDEIKATATSLDGAIEGTGAAFDNFARSLGLSLPAAKKMLSDLMTEFQNLRKEAEALAAERGSTKGLENLLNLPRGGILDKYANTIAGGIEQFHLEKGTGDIPAITNQAAWQAVLDDIRKSVVEVKNLSRETEKEAAATQKVSEARRQAAEASRQSASILGRTLGSAEEAQKIIDTFKQVKSLDFSNVKTYSNNVNALANNMALLKQQTGASTKDIANYLTNNLGVPANAAAQAVKKLNGELGNIDENGHRVVRGLDAIRIALGAIVAMIVFQAIQAISNFFTSAISQARELELSLYNLRNAEKKLSEEGVDITPKGLLESIDAIQKLVPILTKAEATELVSSVANLTSELGFSAKQIDELSQVIAVLYVRNKSLGKSFDEIRRQVITAFQSGTVTKGLGQLGVKITDSMVQQEALRLGLIKTADAYSKLEGDTKSNIIAQATLSLAMKSVEIELGALKDGTSEYLDTNDYAISELSKTWKDFTSNAGQGLTPILAALAKFATYALQIGQLISTGVRGGMALATAAVSAFVTVIRLIPNILKGQISVIDAWKQAWVLSLEEAGRVFGMTMKGQVENGFADTATQIQNTTQSLEELQAALAEGMKGANFDDLLHDLEDFQKKAEQMEQDFNTKMDRMLEDYNRSKERAQQDYNNDVQRTMEDFARKRKEAEQKYRDKEKDAEAKFQEQMRQLREKFLFNLEDALHERDARQVLRLIRQYNMDKQAMINEEALRRDSAVKEHQEEMERLRQEEADRLAQMEEEFKIKQQRAKEDYDLKVARENEEHKTDMDRLKEQIDERLKTFADKLAEELGLREGGAEEIYKVLQKYYGAGGYFDGLYDYSAKSMVSRAQQMMSLLQQIMSQYAQMTSAISGTPMLIPGLKVPKIPTIIPPGIGSSPRFEGKSASMSLSAIRPTALATSGLTGAASPMSGQLGVEILLSPDLEARIVENSVNNVADVITKVRRTK